MSRQECAAAELTFSEAKSALGLSPSLTEVKGFRDKLSTPNGLIQHENPIVLRFPQELVLAYLGRANKPFTKVENARRYTSGDNQLSYDRIDYEVGENTVTLFTPHTRNDITLGNSFDIYVPPFDTLWKNYWEEEGKPESFTTLLHVDSKGMTVTKAYLDQRLTEALRSDKVSPSQIKTGREVAMLKMLQELGIRAPKVLGFNADKTAFAMEFISGQVLLDWMYQNELSDKDVYRIANLAVQTQKRLDTKKEVVGESFPPYPAHTGNITLFLNETLERVSDEQWAPHLQGEMRSKFQNLVRTMEGRFSEKPEYYEANDAIYGDFAVNNIMKDPRGELILIDPILSKGRRSMDLGRLGRSILARNIDAFHKYFPRILSKYNVLSDSPVSSQEVTDMLCLELLRILSLLLKVPDDQLDRFPGYIKEVSRDKLGLYVDTIIPQLLENGI